MYLKYKTDRWHIDREKWKYIEIPDWWEINKLRGVKRRRQIESFIEENFNTNLGYFWIRYIVVEKIPFTAAQEMIEDCKSTISEMNKKIKRIEASKCDVKS